MWMYLEGGFYPVTGQAPTEKTFNLLNMGCAAGIREQREDVRQCRTYWMTGLTPCMNKIITR